VRAHIHKSTDSIGAVFGSLSRAISKMSSVHHVSFSVFQCDCLVHNLHYQRLGSSLRASKVNKASELSSWHQTQPRLFLVSVQDLTRSEVNIREHFDNDKVGRPSQSLLPLEGSIDIACRSTAAMSVPNRISSIRPSSVGTAPGSGQSPALVARINEKRAELENLKQLKELSGNLADQMQALEDRLSTLSDGTEGSSPLEGSADMCLLLCAAVAAVLSNWQNVLRAINMASSTSPG